MAQIPEQARRPCPICGEMIVASAAKCRFCGEIFDPQFKARELREAGSGEDAITRMMLPVGRSGWAIAAGYLGLLSLVMFPAPLALLTGILAVRDIRRNPEKHGMGRAVFGIVMGALGTGVLIIGAVAAIVESSHRR